MIPDNKIKYFTFTVISALFILTAAVLGLMKYFNSPTGKSDTVTLEISKGMTAGEIALMLHDKRIIRNVSYFKFVSKLHGYSMKFKAGKHVLSGKMNANEIARLLVQNPPVPPDINVTVFEGLNINETAAVLASAANIDSSDFVRLAMDKDIAQKMGVDNYTLEGYLYPDTYFIRPDTKPIEMITRMVKRFNTVFNDSLKKRAEEINMSVHEVVTLASIIETEAGLDEDRPIISSVFHRRLKLKRPLEANPTIQYAIGSKRRVLTEDLKIDSPYNTYTNPGLPPGPIASPGEKSLLAALYPAETRYLYFMADGKGGHVFSKTLNEHIKAMRRYRKQRRQLSNN
ncbi:MAG TPA: endolytic transglycosylase MltG [bacterium]|nr:endolytic transglycosylase MltG [bacterium]